jgi:hypothetical protein
MAIFFIEHVINITKAEVNKGFGVPKLSNTLIEKVINLEIRGGAAGSNTINQNNQIAKLNFWS